MTIISSYSSAKPNFHKLFDQLNFSQFRFVYSLYFFLCKQSYCSKTPWKLRIRSLELVVGSSEQVTYRFIILGALSMLIWLTDYQILFRNTDKSMKKLLCTAENYLLNFWIIVTRQLKLTEFSENRVVLQNISEIQMTWLTQGCVWQLNTITKNLLGIFTGYFEWEWSNRLSISFIICMLWLPYSRELSITCY